MNERNVVSVILWNHEVGRTYWDEKLKRAVFNFNPGFINLGLDIAPLTASINRADLRSGLPYLGNKENKIYKGLPEFLADSLPDKWGETLMRYWSERNYETARFTSVDGLSFIGKRAMGALEFKPSMVDFDKPFDVDLKELYGLADAIFSEREGVSLPEEDISIQSLYRVGTSAGGKQPKAVIAINQHNGEVKSGQTTLGKDYRYYILKFNRNEPFPYTELEKTYYDMALSSGIKMMPYKTISIGGVPHFLTERFDREDGEKVHAQTLAAMSPDADSYEDLLTTVRKLRCSESDVLSLYLLAVFNVMSGNMDDHNKNFSFLMGKDGKWRVSPAYDLNFSVDVTGPRWNNVHYLSINGKDRDITKDDLIEFGERNDIRNPQGIVDKTVEVIRHFPLFASKNGVKEGYIEGISKYLSQSNGIYIETGKSYIINSDKLDLDVDNFVLRKVKGRMQVSTSVNGHKVGPGLVPDDKLYAYHAGALGKSGLLWDCCKDDISKLDLDKGKEEYRHIHR